MKPLTTEFGSRLVQLSTGALGLRGGIGCDVRLVEFKDLTAAQIKNLTPNAPMEDDQGKFPCMDFISSDERIDRYNERIIQSGWIVDNFCANPVIPDCHDYSSIQKILARDLLAKDEQVRDGRLGCRSFFALDNPLGLLAWKMARGGFIKSQSVGFIPVEWKNAATKDDPDRTFTKAELLEKSLVVVPANPGATVGLALKSGAIEKADVNAVVAMLRTQLAQLDPLCSDKANPDAKAGAPGAGVDGARLLQLARSLGDVLRRA